MGFPKEFKIKDIGVSDTQLYKQFGNSVAVPVVRVVAEEMISVMAKFDEKLMENKRQKRVEELSKHQDPKSHSAHKVEEETST